MADKDIGGTIILDSSDDEPSEDEAGNGREDPDYIPLTMGKKKLTRNKGTRCKQTKTQTVSRKVDIDPSKKKRSSAPARKRVKPVAINKDVSTIILESSDDETVITEAGKSAPNIAPVSAKDIILDQTPAPTQSQAPKDVRQRQTKAETVRRKVGKRSHPTMEKEGVAAPTRKKIKQKSESDQQRSDGASDAIASDVLPPLQEKKEIVVPSLPCTSGTASTMDSAPNDSIIDVDAEWEAKYGWRVEDEVAAATNQRADVVRNVVRLLEKECTIPFIARYRREDTGGLMADILQDIQQTHNNMLAVKKKALAMIKSLETGKKADAETRKMIYSAKTLDELEHLYAPYKEAKGRSLAQRAKALGLEDAANKILHGEATVMSLQLEDLVKHGTKGLENIHVILLGLQHIIAEYISRHRDVLDYLSNLSKQRGIMIRVKKSAAAVKKAKDSADGKCSVDDKKYDNYVDLFRPVDSLQPHQVMAINRGESQKILTVKIELPESFSFMINSFCKDKLNLSSTQSKDGDTRNLIDAAVDDAYSRLLVPYIQRHVRSSLTKEAEKESVNVFRSNLRQLLLTPPIRGHTVMGIDPGFRHGCKIAVVSPSGDLLSTGIVFPHGGEAQARSSANKITQLAKQHGCDLIALGDGTASRETEKFLSSLISQGAFQPLEVEYCTVNESGVSIYSVTKEAEEELPGLDPNLRSAVGIARRLQDPLLEYVKVEAKHLGVGMYQHDISQCTLKNALEGVVVECVSFVGVDVNVCPEAVLRKVSGLNASTAKNIVEWRRTHGPFKNRQQLLTVKRLGAKAYEQCAGFVKIYKETSQAPCNPPPAKKAKMGIPNSFEPFDMTIIHPESYQFAELFVTHLGLQKSDLGTPAFTRTVRREVERRGVNHFVNTLGGSIATMQLIAEALQQKVDEDIRSEHDKPVFRRSIAQMSDLCVGEVYTGRIKNCTNFGAFVDIGVGKDGLIHVSHMNRLQPKLGDRVTVKITNLDVSRGRIGLQLISLNAQ
ncbi:S1 RNA-binding domain-containing protein 1-like [Ornithodoros turicata]|uniref:S1 RNA-binding domain-containing protein 1-like n=1 Tax=Ornithodoros turicata TaxID=34597 RepID=UPI0031392DB8